MRPILVESCFPCHSGQAKTLQGGLRLDSRAGLLKGGFRGPAFTAAKPEGSRLLEAIGYVNKDLTMPPKGKLSEEKIAALTAWVTEGAAWPKTGAKPSAASASTFSIKQRAAHWSFQPIVRPVAPQVQPRGWAANAVDRFILAGLQKAGLKPAPQADRTTLIRRVTFDLIGLPPTPAEIDDFLADRQPGAYRRLVDRLLASPRYGERWARHWLDLVRYAETDGHEFDFEKQGAFEYRDYVIRALNADLPFDQFVREHVAGDLLKPRIDPTSGRNESLTATGFWYMGEGKHSPVDLKVDEGERVDNQIDVFGKAFLGLTLGCARCHDHKFDPISTRDYYALSGVLKSSRFQQANIVSPPGMAEAVRSLQSVRTRMLAVSTWQLAGIAAIAGIETFEEFDGTNFGDWMQTGSAFGAGPVADVLRLSGRGSEARIDALGASGAADSGALGEKLEGALRSRTFRVSKPFILYRMAIDGDTEVNLVLDGFQRIRDPLYGRLKIRANSNGKLAWFSQDVSKFIGHRGYIEFVDYGPGKIAVDTVAFSDKSVPQEPAAPRTASGAAESGVVEALLLERQAIENSILAPVYAMAMTDGTGEDDVVHIRGSYKTPGAAVGRRFLEVCSGANQQAPARGSGRQEIADRMLAPTNTLVRRVIVNRLWHHHFGRGLAATPDDLGFMGLPPSHPKLLDWLASEFLAQNWSIKQMHRMMVLSSTYQMSSTGDVVSERTDPTNRLVHRMPVRRLEAEAIRDTLLAVSGRLDLKMYGPSVLPYLTSFMEGRGRPGSSGPLDGTGRRSIYMGVRRNFLNPMFLAFDFPVPFNSMGRRNVSNVPAQALTMMNNPFVVEQAGVWAARLLSISETDQERITRMYRTALGRSPTPDEVSQAQDFVQSQETGDTVQPQLRAWQDLAHVFFNLKEFIFVR